MEIEELDYILDYNTEREKLVMREYGRNVSKMVKMLREIPDRAVRSEQAQAVVKVMEVLNPQVRTQENYVHKLWDQLYIIADYDLDIDSPFPKPVREDFASRPLSIPMKDERIKATHYGRNIEKIMNLLCDLPDGEEKTELIRNLAIYMRTQYLIWNKDSVDDGTIFKDIEKLSEGRLDIPEGLTLGELSPDANFNRPGSGQSNAGGNPGRARTGKRKNNKFRKK